MWLFRDPFGTSTEGAIQTIVDLLAWFGGKNPVVNHMGDSAAADLSHTPGMQDIRNQYKQKSCSYSGFICNNYQYTQLRTTDNLTGQVVGSFCVKFTPLGNGRTLVNAQNTFSLASATRLPELPFRGSNRANPTLSDMLLRSAPLLWPNSPIYWPSSLIHDKQSGWLRNMTVHYHWLEKNPCCDQ